MAGHPGAVRAGRGRCKFQQGEARFRLVPTQADRQSFFACITRSSSAGGQDSIGQAYRFFRSHVELLGPDDEPLDLSRLTAIVVERLAAVGITTGQGDNAHRIFQSLNATGSTSPRPTCCAT